MHLPQASPPAQQKQAVPGRGRRLPRTISWWLPPFEDGLDRTTCGTVPGTEPSTRRRGDRGARPASTDVAGIEQRFGARWHRCHRLPTADDGAARVDDGTPPTRRHRRRRTGAPRRRSGQRPRHRHRRRRHPGHQHDRARDRAGHDEHRGRADRRRPLVDGQPSPGSPLAGSRWCSRAARPSSATMGAGSPTGAGRVGGRTVGVVDPHLGATGAGDGDAVGAEGLGEADAQLAHDPELGGRPGLDDQADRVALRGEGLDAPHLGRVEDVVGEVRVGRQVVGDLLDDRAACS